MWSYYILFNQDFLLNLFRLIFLVWILNLSLSTEEEATTPEQSRTFFNWSYQSFWTKWNIRNFLTTLILFKQSMWIKMLIQKVAEYICFILFLLQKNIVQEIKNIALFHILTNLAFNISLVFCQKFNWSEKDTVSLPNFRRTRRTERIFFFTFCFYFQFIFE